jgi:hypothetical protein
MSNTNRRRAQRLMNPPSSQEVRETREAAKLSPADAAAMIYYEPKWWSQVEAGVRPMAPALWEYWRLLLGSSAVQRARRELLEH